MDMWGRAFRHREQPTQRPRGRFLKEVLRKVGWAERGSGVNGVREAMRDFTVKETGNQQEGGLGGAVTTSGQALEWGSGCCVGSGL